MNYNIFSCPRCGTVLQTSSSAQPEKIVRCSHCGFIFPAPISPSRRKNQAAESAVDFGAASWVEWQPSNTSEPAPPPIEPPMRVRRRPLRAKRRPPALPWINLIVGLTVGLAALGLIIVLIVALWPSSKGREAAGSNQTESNQHVKKSAQQETWIDAAKGATKIGKFEVQISYWRIDKVTRHGQSGGVDMWLESMHDSYIVGFKITNVTSSEALYFRGLTKMEGISLTDNLGNSYHHFIPPQHFKWDEEFESGEIQPGETVSDALDFSSQFQEFRKADFLKLEIPGKAFGVQESLRLRIPPSLFRKD